LFLMEYFQNLVMIQYHSGKFLIDSSSRIQKNKKLLYGVGGLTVFGAYYLYNSDKKIIVFNEDTSSKVLIPKGLVKSPTIPKDAHNKSESQITSKALEKKSNFNADNMEVVDVIPIVEPIGFRNKELSTIEAQVGANQPQTNSPLPKSDSSVDRIKEIPEASKEKIKDSFENVKDSIKKSIKETEEKIKEKATDLKGSAKETAKKPFETASEKVSEMKNATKEKIKDSFENVKESIKKPIVETEEKIKEKATDLKGSAKETAKKPFIYMADKSSEIKENLLDKMLETKEDIKESGKDKLMAAKEKISDDINFFSEKTKEKLNSSKDKLRETAKEKATELEEKGKPFIEKAKEITDEKILPQAKEGINKAAAWAKESFQDLNAKNEDKKIETKLEEIDSKLSKLDSKLDKISKNIK